MRAFFASTFLLLVLCSGAQTDTTDKIYTFVEHNPEYLGGDAELMKFFTKNIRYPASNNESEICGSVKVRFIIDIDGSVISPQVTKSCGHDWDTELLRVLKLLPKFKPGYQNGKEVKVYFNLPIHFEFNKSTDKN